MTAVQKRIGQALGLPLHKVIVKNKRAGGAFGGKERMHLALIASVSHTSYNSFYKWTKISSLEIIIFELKNDGKKWSRIHFEIDRAPSELLLPSAKISAQNGRIGLAA